MYRIWSCVSVLILLLTGCGGGNSRPDPAAPRPATTTTPAPGEPADAANPVTDSISEPLKTQVEEFSRKIASTMSARDATYLDGHLDLGKLVDAAIAGLALPSSDKNAFKQGVQSRGGLANQIAASMGEDGSYTFLRARKCNGKPSAVCRLITSEGAVNYHELILEPDAQGFQIVDLYIFAAGEHMSQMLRRGIMPLVLQKNRGLLDKLTGRENELYKNYPKVQLLLNQMQSGQNQQALQTYASLPASVKKDKTIMLMRLKTAMQCGDAEYQAAMDDFEKNAPGDAALDLISIDNYFIKKRFGEAIQAIDRVDKNVGGDPYLRVLRGNALFESGKQEEGKAEIRKATQEEPKLAQAYFALVTHALTQKNHPETAQLLSEIESKLGIKMDGVSTAPEYADFVKSREYDGWIKTRQ